MYEKLTPEEQFKKNFHRYLTPYKLGRPVLQGSGIPGTFDSQAVDIPFVFRHHGKFHMVYTGFDGRGYQSALAVSDDLLHWTHKGMILGRLENSDRWDRVGAGVTWLIKEKDSLFETPRLKKIDGKYWLVYHSYPGEGYEEGPAEIGLAWTQDEELLDWHRLDKPVFSWRDGEEWECGGLYKGCIVDGGDGWNYLLYNAKNAIPRWNEQMGVARSRDLFHWERMLKHPAIPVSADGWDSRFVSAPTIVRDGDLWLDFFFGYDGMKYKHAMQGLAYSSDLIHWTKHPDPILQNGAPGELDANHAHKASLFYWDGTLYHFYCATRSYQPGDPAEALGEFRTITVAASKPFLNK